MTTYLEQKLRKRELGSGCETYAYEKWGDKNLATIFTSNKYKWYWLNFLGLTRSEQTRVYVQWAANEWRDKPRREPAWRFDVLKLMPIGYEDPRFKLVWREVSKFSQYAYGSTKILKADPAEFDILRPVVEFCQLAQVTYCVTDSNWFNFLQHPKTKRIYPYDYFVPQDNLRIDLL